MHLPLPCLAVPNCAWRLCSWSSGPQGAMSTLPPSILSLEVLVSGSLPFWKGSPVGALRRTRAWLPLWEDSQGWRCPLPLSGLAPNDKFPSQVLLTSYPHTSLLLCLSLVKAMLVLAPDTCPTQWTCGLPIHLTSSVDLRPPSTQSCGDPQRPDFWEGSATLCLKFCLKLPFSLSLSFPQ